jgi:hypothetical protein
MSPFNVSSVWEIEDLLKPIDCGALQFRQMTRLGRWLFNCIAGLSLVLCVATAALWIRSYFRLDDISHTGQWHVHNFSSVRGRTFIQWGWSTEDELKLATGPYARGGFVWDSPSSGATLGVEKRSCGWRLGGFDYFSWTGRMNAAGQPTAGEHVTIVPWWFLCTFAALSPIWWLIRTRRQARRARFGCCLTCGYDLRATPDRCPECGAIPPKKEVISY